MKTLWTLSLAFLIASAIAVASQSDSAKKSAKSAPATKTFAGSIGDSMCGLKHGMAGDDKKCTLECVKNGAKYILADTEHQKVYQLSDQKKPEEFAGQKVKVMGTLKGDLIEVKSIAAAQ